MFFVQGDSGGPLVVRQSAGRFQVLGVNSWACGRCLNKYPNIFTNVYYYLEWILQHAVPWD